MAYKNFSDIGFFGVLIFGFPHDNIIQIKSKSILEITHGY